MGRRAAEVPTDATSQPIAATPDPTVAPARAADTTPGSRREVRERERAAAQASAAQASSERPPAEAKPADAEPIRPNRADAKPADLEPGDVDAADVEPTVAADWSEWTPKAARSANAPSSTAPSSATPHRVRARRASAAVLSAVKPARKRTLMRRAMAIAAACGALALVPALMLSAPSANAQTTLTAAQLQGQHRGYESGQTLAVSSGVAGANATAQSYGATAYVPPAAVTTASGASSSQAVAGGAISSSQQAAAQVLVQAIQAGTLTFQPNAAPDPEQQIEWIAAGQSVPDCDDSLGVLQVLEIALNNFGSVQVSDMNRLCNGTVTSSGGFAGDPHSANGGGRAVDINEVGGVVLDGSNSQDIKLLTILEQYAPVGGAMEWGQSECRQSAGDYFDAANVNQFEDSCTHQHVDVGTTTPYDYSLAIP
jgi:hypothetical protein